MLTKLRSANDLPYTKEPPHRFFVSVLVPNDIDLTAFDDLDGYILVTKSPKMTIVMLEYQDGEYSKISKEIWKRVQYISKNKKIEEIKNKNG